MGAFACFGSAWSIGEAGKSANIVVKTTLKFPPYLLSGAVDVANCKSHMHMF